MSEEMAADKITIKLKKPLKVGDKVIDELVISEPTAGQFEASEKFSKTKGGTEQALQLLALATNIHASVLKNLAGSDFTKASKALGSFFEDGQETGENLSQN